MRFRLPFRLAIRFTVSGKRVRLLLGFFAAATGTLVLISRRIAAAVCFRFCLLLISACSDKTERFAEMCMAVLGSARLVRRLKSLVAADTEYKNTEWQRVYVTIKNETARVEV